MVSLKEVYQWAAKEWAQHLDSLGLIDRIFDAEAHLRRRALTAGISAAARPQKVGSLSPTVSWDTSITVSGDAPFRAAAAYSSVSQVPSVKVRLQQS